jgi:hypothetical protein
MASARTCARKPRPPARGHFKWSVGDAAGLPAGCWPAPLTIAWARLASATPRGLGPLVGQRDRSRRDGSTALPTGVTTFSRRAETSATTCTWARGLRVPVSTRASSISRRSTVAVRTGTPFTFSAGVLALPPPQAAAARAPRARLERSIFLMAVFLLTVGSLAADPGDRGPSRNAEWRGRRRAPKAPQAVALGLRSGRPGRQHVEVRWLRRAVVGLGHVEGLLSLGR